MPFPSHGPFAALQQAFTEEVSLARELHELRRAGLGGERYPELLRELEEARRRKQAALIALREGGEVRGPTGNS